MIKRFVTVLAIISLCTAAASANRGTLGAGPTVSMHNVMKSGVQVQEAGESVDVDLSGVTTWDLEADAFTIGVVDPDNIATKITIVPATSGPITGVGWDTIQTTTTVGGGLSWGSEMVIGFDGNDDGLMELQLTPSLTEAPITMEPNTSGGIIKLVDAGIPDIAHNGTIDLYFYESYDDNIDAADGLFEAGSMLTIQTAVPEPAALSMLMLAGLSGLILRRRS